MFEFTPDSAYKYRKQALAVLDETRDLVGFYRTAKATVQAAGYGDEIDWQRKVTIEGLTVPEIIGDIMFVILNSGMKATVARKLNDELRLVFAGFANPAVLWELRDGLRLTALRVLNHPGKIDAVFYAIRWFVEHDLDEFKGRLKAEGVDFLQTFPFIGKITRYHLGKNLGLDVCKPDRWLVRVAERFDTTPEILCEYLSEQTGDRIPVVDIVLWRYCEMGALDD